MSSHEVFQSAASVVEASGREQHVGDQAVRLLTQIQVCRRLGISVQTWRNWRAAQLVPPPLDLPGHPRWRVADIDAFEDGRIARPGRKTYFATAVHRRFR